MAPVAIGWPLRSHSNVNVGLLAHVPGLQVTVWPTCIVPVTCGVPATGAGTPPTLSRAPKDGPPG